MSAPLRSTASIIKSVNIVEGNLPLRDNPSHLFFIFGKISVVFILSVFFGDSECCRKCLLKEKLSFSRPLHFPLVFIGVFIFYF